tara:strand:- start:1200 stop:1589 length:390 start_codon:yes stop_codon:yes gene_type:complete
MRGPIIKEHATNVSVLSGATVTYRVKSDGRTLRVYYKYDVGVGGGNNSVKVKPVAHFSDGDVALAAWPEDSASTTNYLVQPEQGEITASGATAGKSIYVLGDGVSAEYEITVTGAAGGIVELYLISELV